MLRIEELEPRVVMDGTLQMLAIQTPWAVMVSDGNGRQVMADPLTITEFYASEETSDPQGNCRFSFRGTVTGGSGGGFQVVTITGLSSGPIQTTTVNDGTFNTGPIVIPVGQRSGVTVTAVATDLFGLVGPSDPVEDYAKCTNSD